MLHMHKFVYIVTPHSRHSMKADTVSSKCKNSSLYMSHGAFGIASPWFGGWVMFGKPNTWVTSQPPRYNQCGRRLDIISRSHEKLRLRLKDCMTHQLQFSCIGCIFVVFFLPESTWSRSVLSSPILQWLLLQSHWAPENRKPSKKWPRRSF